MAFAKQVLVALLLVLQAGGAFSEGPKNTLEEDIQSMTRGKVQHFVRRGLSTALGVSVNLDLPQGWKLSDPNQPNIIGNFFQSRTNRQSFMNVEILAMTFRSQKTSDPAELVQRELVYRKFLDMLKLNNDTIENSSRVIIDGKPCLLVSYRRLNPGVRGDLFSEHFIEYVFFQNNRVVEVVFGLTVRLPLPGSSMVETDLQSFSTLSDLIARSIRLKFSEKPSLKDSGI